MELYGTEEYNISAFGYTDNIVWVNSLLDLVFQVISLK